MSYIVSFSSSDPFGREELARLWAVTIISAILLGASITYQPSVDSPLFLLTLFSGITLFVCLWLFLGNAIHKIKKK